MAPAQHGVRAVSGASPASVSLKLQVANPSSSSALSMPSRELVPGRHEEGWSEKGTLFFQRVEGSGGSAREEGLQAGLGCAMA